MYRNEGGKAIEAINQYDNQVLSVGIFQWTLVGGELAGLFSPDNLPTADYNELLGKWGIEPTGVAEDRSTPGIWRGKFKLDGKVLSGNLSEELRSFRWAHRFYEACKDPRLQLAQYNRALGRLRGMLRIELRAPGCTVPASELLQTEELRTQALDQYVNRPAHVKTALQDCLTALYKPNYLQSDLLGAPGTWEGKKFFDLWTEKETQLRRALTLAEMIALYDDLQIYSIELWGLKLKCELATQLPHSPPTVDCKKKELSALTTAQRDVLMELYRWHRNNLQRPRMTHPDDRWTKVLSKRKMTGFAPLKDAIRVFTP